MTAASRIGRRFGSWDDSDEDLESETFGEEKERRMNRRKARGGRSTVVSGNAGLLSAVLSELKYELFSLEQMEVRVYG